MAERSRNGAEGFSRHTDDGRRREQFASSVDLRCDLVGIGPDTPVRWVLDRDTKAIIWVNLREVEDGHWVLGTVTEERDIERQLLGDHPGLIDRDEGPGVTMGNRFPAWAHAVHDLRDDGRWEFVR